MIVLSLCAMVSIVQPRNSSLIVFCMRSSVSMSTAAVASSRIRILVLRSNVRARHTSWRWPTLKSNSFVIMRVFQLFWLYIQTDSTLYKVFQLNACEISQVFLLFIVNIVYNIYVWQTNPSKTFNSDEFVRFCFF